MGRQASGQPQIGPRTACDLTHNAMIHGHAECLTRSLKRICYHRWQKICGNSQLTSIRTIHQHFIGNVLSFPPTDKSYRYPPAPLEAQVPDDLQQPHKPSHIGRHMNIDRQDTFRTSHHGVVPVEVSATDRDIGRIRLRTDIGAGGWGRFIMLYVGEKIFLSASGG